MQEVLRQLHAEGYAVDEAHFDSLSPCRYEHINRLSKYTFTNSGDLDSTHRRPLRDTGNN
ncbi:Tn3 transposase DDE domain-containing protein [Spirosoma oryzae]|uniref:Tn3 transposase DDE domain-containing protein n=1 Tax=Spirosoma oryzae TaxID=1469603 RepID=A0A2T0S362_9BACT|nr:Tn3 transposase DDE domain-containing protein [Spirosoma oryzae]